MTAVERNARLRYARWLLVVCALIAFALFAIAALFLFLRSTPGNSSQSGPPRSITAEQSQLLLQELAKHPAHPLTIRTDTSDHEAKQFAQQLYDTLRNSQWHVDMSADSTGAVTCTGLCVVQTGESARPPYPNPSQDPYFFLPAVFAAAHIPVAGESGQAAGQYQLYVVIGSRELTQPAVWGGSPRLRARRWLLRRIGSIRRHLISALTR